MKHYYTALIEYDRPEDMPRVHAGMEALGGKVIAVHFDDMFKELERIEAEREACAKEIEPRGPRPCKCVSCDGLEFCGSIKVSAVEEWDSKTECASAIRSRSEK